MRLSRYKMVDSERSCGSVTFTYAARLPLAREWLELLRIAELDENIDAPLLVVVVAREAHLARTAKACISVSQTYAETPQKTAR